MDEPALADEGMQPQVAYLHTSTEDHMTSTIPLSFLGDRSLWGEDLQWLAEHRAWYALGHVEPRVRWLHLYLEAAPGNPSDVLVRAQLDLAGQDLCSVCAIRSTPQSALCTAFDLLRDEISRHDLIAG